MAEKTVYVKVGAKVDGAVAGIRKVKASVDDLTRADIKKPSQAFADMSTKAALMGGAVALGVGKAVASFAEFDAQMSAVSAALPDAGAQIGQLRDLAVKLGKDTQFSATEAAQGVTEMAKAGVSAADILNGGLKGGLDLAAAGQLDVAQASEIAATALNQFGLRGKDVSHVADLYAAAAGKAQGSVQDIALAMKYAGVTASSMGVSIEDATAVLGLFASKGIIGEQAGTTFRSMLVSLTAPSKIAATAMQDLGINVYDAGGKFVGMQGAADELQRKLGPLDEATRNQALGQIFGNEALGGAIALYEGGGQAVDAWRQKVNDGGFATKQAAKLTDNLKGDVERLSGSLETVFIQAGSGANDSLRSLAQGLGGLVDGIGKIPGPVLLAGSALGSLALLAPKGILMWRNYKTQLDTLGISMDKLRTKAPRTASAIRGIGMAGVGLAGLAATIRVLAGNLEELGSEQLIARFADTGNAIESINTALAGVGGGTAFRAQVSDIGEVLRLTFNANMTENIDNTVGSILGLGDTTAVGIASTRLSELDRTLASLVSAGNADQAAQMMAAITTEAAKQGINVDQIKAKLPQYAEAIAGAANAASNAAGPTGKLGDATADLKQQAEDAQAALDDLKATIEGFGSPVAAARAAERDFQSAIDDVAKSLKDNGKTLDVNTEKGRANQAALDAIRDATLKNVTATFDLTGSSDKATAAMQRGRDAFIKAATEAGIAAPKAKKLADNMGLIPEDVKTQITMSGVPTAEKQLKDVKSLIDQLKDKTIHITTVYRSLAIAAGTQAARVHSEYSRPGELATGGPVRGPGTGTSDTAGIYALSNGEHVLTAAEVAAAGGHAAIFALRKAILSGGVQFRAAGGPAIPANAYRPAPPPVFDVSRLVAAQRGRGGDTFNVTAGDPVRAAQMVVAELEWRAVNG